MSYLDRVFENSDETIEIPNIVNFQTGKLKVNSVAITTSLGETVTADAAELNKLDGMSATKQELINACDHSENVEVVTETNVIAATESGKTFFLNSATEFVSTLPLPSAGLRFSFIVALAPTGADYTIVTTSGANIIKAVGFAADGEAFVVHAAADTITLVRDVAIAGDRVDVICDGTSYFAYCFCKDKDAITFSAT